VTNDTAAPWSGEVRWSLERLDGAVVATGREPVEARGTATTAAGIVPLGVSLAGSADPKFRRGTVLVAELWGDGGMVTRTVTTFGPDKQLALAQPAVERSVEIDERSGGRRAVVRVRTGSLARWVELALDGADVVFDDNYVDLPAGREVAIGFELPAGWTLEKARECLRIRSVVDTYA
jgi:beta-mannosidase